jgi:organic hydroperoxide reductase OsmC/OhrA
MQDLPHHYRVAANGTPEGDIQLTAAGLETIATTPPPEFGGPEDRWSPETLFVASISSWVSVECDAEGKLERIEGRMRFTEVAVKAVLHVPADTDEQKAHRLLEKAEETCLITNSLSAARRLEAVVLVASQ